MISLKSTESCDPKLKSGSKALINGPFMPSFSTLRPCPNCGGDDKFIFWPKDDQYWCRQCNVKGDSIQFCRDFLGLDYRSACLKSGIESKTSFSNRGARTPIFSPENGFFGYVKKSEFIKAVTNKTKNPAEN
jgi:hypothetical protein